MIKIIKVTGTSLSPFFLPDDYVLVWRSPSRFRNLSPGDFVVFDHHDYGMLIKRVIHNDPQEGWIETEGTHPNSLPAHKIGRIPYENIIGKVIHRIKG